MLPECFTEGGWYVAVKGDGAEGRACQSEGLVGKAVELRARSEGRVDVLWRDGIQIGYVDGDDGHIIASALGIGAPIRAIVRGVHGHQAGRRSLVLLVDADTPRNKPRLSFWRRFRLDFLADSAA